MPVKLRILGLMLAMVALGSAIVSSASADVTHDFEAEASPYIVTGAQTAASPLKYEFSEGASLTCGVNKLNGTVSKSPASSLTVQPTFGVCLLSELTAVVDSESCRYVFTGLTDKLGHAKVDIECVPSQKLRITLSGCTIEIGEQTAETGASFVNTGSGKTRDVDIEVTATKLAYVKSGAACALIAGLGGDLSMRGTYTVQAYQDNKEVEGSQIGFWTTPTVV